MHVQQYQEKEVVLAQEHSNFSFQQGSFFYIKLYMYINESKTNELRLRAHLFKIRKRKENTSSIESTLQTGNAMTPPATSGPLVPPSPMVLASPMDLSSSSSSGGDDDGSSHNGGSTLNSQEEEDGNRTLLPQSPLFSSSMGSGRGLGISGSGTSGIAVSGGASSAAGGGHGSASITEELNSLVVVGSVATTISSYDSVGSLSTIESSASVEVSQRSGRQPFTARPSLLKPVSEPEERNNDI